MRTSLVEDRFAIAPGGSLELTVEVFNTREVIDGISAHLVGFDEATVLCDPPELALFPDSSGSIRLSAKMPSGFAAGEHVVELELRSSVPGGTIGRERVLLEVAPSREVTLKLRPSQMVGRTKGSSTVDIVNVGNVAQTLMLTASDPQNLLQLTFARPVVELGPGASALVELDVVAKRRLFGANVTMAFVVAGRILEDPDAIEPQAEPVPVETRGTFVQKPVLAAGMMTALVLALIVVAWAGAMLLGLKTVMGRDPVGKTAAASFYASSAAVQEAAGGGKGAGGGGGAGAAPAGAVPKEGAAAGIGGSVSGIIRVASNNEGIGRITVQAIHVDPRGRAEVVSAAATDEDGTYEIAGLLPGPYSIRLTGTGIEGQWYPDATSRAGARDVRVLAGKDTGKINATVEGDPVTVSGTVDLGLVDDGTGAPPPTVAIAVSRSDGADAESPPPVFADEAGAFSIPGLEAPASYVLAIAAADYETSTVPFEVSAGDDLALDTLHLSAGPGALAGTVTDGSSPLGGVEVTASFGDLEWKTATPTVGGVGQFTLPDLPTPGTYLLSFELDGYATVNRDVALGPGESLLDLAVELPQGSGSIQGRVTAGGTGVVGATVTVNGGTAPVTTATLAEGPAAGTYAVAGLVAPGTYTVTVTAEGYASETIRVRLGGGGTASGQDVALTSSLGTLRGIVSDPSGDPIEGITVTIRDATTETTTTTGADPKGEYVMPGLVPGRYTVTFGGLGRPTRSYAATIAAGSITTIDGTLEDAA
ncbi:MAG: hypothetical protein JWM47_1946 [Acidimicrobiales bacterium]|nr:hypothetical protein [Acidimicrobiales bacterium]